MRARSRTFAAFLLSYALVALLPLIGGFAYFYPQINENVIDRALREANGAVEQLSENLDIHLKAITGVPSALFANDRITRWSLENDPLSRLDVQKELKKIIQGNGMLDDISIFMRKAGHLISANSGSITAENIRRYRGLYGLQFPNWPVEDMLATFQTLTEPVTRPAEPVQLNGVGAGDAIVFLQTLPPNNRFAYATVMERVSAKSLRALVPNPAQGSETVFFGADGNVLYATGEGMTARAEALHRETEGASGAKVLRVDGADLLLAWSDSSPYGWKCVQTLPMTSILKDVQRLQRQTALWAGFSGLALACVITLFMQFTYRPLDRLARLAGRFAPHGDPSGAFQTIRAAIERLEGDNSRLNAHVQATQPELAQLSLMRLLNPPAPADDPGAVERLAANAAQCGIPAKAGLYQVLAAAYADSKAMDSAFADLKAEEGAFPLRQSERRELWILLASAADEREPAEAPLGNLRNAAFPPAYLGIGMPVGALSEAHASLSQALTALEFCRLHGETGGEARYDRLPKSAFRAKGYPLEVMQALSFAIARGDAEKTSALVEQIASAISDTSAPPHYARSLFYNAMNLLLEGLRPYSGEGSLEAIGAESLSMRYTAAEMAAILRGLTERARASVPAFRKDAGEPIERALAYLREHLSSAHLSLTEVADHVAVHPSSLSRLFKQKTGRNFKEYVDALRIETAKRLLTGTKLKIGEIAVQVGYDNSYSFSRLFKNNTGLTPVEYREMQK